MPMISARTVFTLAGPASVALAAVSMPSVVQAQEIEGGLYVTGRVGVTLPSDFNLEGTQDPQSPSPGVAGAPAIVETQLDNDVIYSGAVGYRIPKRLFGVFQPSVELEYSYTNPSVSGGSFNGGSQSFMGDVEVQSFTVNYQTEVIYKEGQRVTPFWGGGIGVADIDSNILYAPATASAPTFTVTRDDTAFTFMSNVGVRFDLTDQISFDARARYQRVNGLELERRFIAAGNDAFNADVSGRYETVNLLAGLRYNF